MTTATLKAFGDLHAAMTDTRTYSARDFELRPIKSYRGVAGTTATDADGTRWAWVESKQVWARTV
jgi:hypothetical protein